MLILGIFALVVLRKRYSPKASEDAGKEPDEAPLIIMRKAPSELSGTARQEQEEGHPEPMSEQEAALSAAERTTLDELGDPGLDGSRRKEILDGLMAMGYTLMTSRPAATDEGFDEQYERPGEDAGKEDGR